MKKYIISLTILLSAPFIGIYAQRGLDPDMELNHTITITPRVASSRIDTLSRYSSLQTVNYFDGLGFPTQSVQHGITPSGKDLVTFQEFDHVGRKYIEYLPGVSGKSGGHFDTSYRFRENAREIYGDSCIYFRTVYEETALNRVLEEYGPGKDWQTRGKSVKMNYGTNTANILFYCVGGTPTSPVLKRKGNYAAEQLYVTQTTDEDDRISFEFKDKQGRLILSRQVNGTTNFDTRYVYDNVGNLVFVLPPLAADALATIDSIDVNHSALKNYGYVYQYDYRNRQIAKRLPGAEWSYYIYDKADRLILAQDAEHRRRGEWLFTIPDAAGRTVLTGTCKNSLSYTALPLKNIVVSAGFTGGTNTYKGYTLSGFTPVTPKVLSVNYYDNYSFMGANGIPVITDSNFKPETLSGYGTCDTSQTKGLLTGTLTAQLKNTSSYQHTVMYYDRRGRLVQAKSNNHLAGGVNKEYTAYNFTGQPLKRKSIHAATGKSTRTEEYTYSYDHAGRLLETRHQLNSGTERLLVKNEYDEVGRLKNKVNHSADHASKLHYDYNVRSWLNVIKGPKLIQELYYNNPMNGAAPSYGGNISEMRWRLGSY